MMVDYFFEFEKQEYVDFFIIIDIVFFDMDVFSEFIFNDDEMEDLGELWIDKVMEYDEDYEDEIFEEWDCEFCF